MAERSPILSCSQAASECFIQPDNLVWPRDGLKPTPGEKKNDMQHYKRGEKKPLKQLTLDTFESCKDVSGAQPFAILCAVALSCSSAALEKRNSGFEGLPLKNLGDFTIVSCRALVFACMW